MLVSNSRPALRFTNPHVPFRFAFQIDDVLRVTKVYVPTTGLKNSFAEPYMNYDNTPEVFAEWNTTLPNVAFQYVSPCIMLVTEKEKPAERILFSVTIPPHHWN